MVEFPSLFFHQCQYVAQIISHCRFGRNLVGYRPLAHRRGRWRDIPTYTLPDKQIVYAHCVSRTAAAHGPAGRPVAVQWAAASAAAAPSANCICTLGCTLPKRNHRLIGSWGRPGQMLLGVAAAAVSHLRDEQFFKENRVGKAVWRKADSFLFCTVLCAISFCEKKSNLDL